MGSRRLGAMLKIIRSLCCLLLLTVAAAGKMDAASADTDSGSYRGRVLTELGIHHQAALQRLRRGIRPLSATSAVQIDIGNIAVMPDDGTLITQANAFDLDGRTLIFRRADAGYTVAIGALNFDAVAATSGQLLNPLPAGNPENIGDDGSKEIPIGFAFPYFGGIFNRVFINSDGNLTFNEEDHASTDRSLARFLTGPPRIAPYFEDLDPAAGGQLTVFSSAAKFVVTWSAVPDFASSGTGPRETFQVALTPDGNINFSYNGISGREAVVGISPGAFSSTPHPVDLSSTASGTALDGPVAEVFTQETQLDLAAVAQRFYQTHEDAYDFLVVFTNFNFDLDGAFAFEINISNDATGIGPVFDPPVFSFANQFGSSRLQSLLNMGNLLAYPENPAQVFLRGVDSTLSVMGQESGHRFLVFADWDDPQGSQNSTALLGRDLQHWSFLFNSDASVMEGNRIRDNGNGTFTTTGAVEHYNEFDQYLMGLRAPQEVNPSFLVKEPSLPISPGAGPTPGITIAGKRANVTVDQIISANGPRVPNAVIAQKRFNFAFLFVVPPGTTADPKLVARMERIRQEWEPFFAAATSFRGTAETELVRGLRVSPSPLGMLRGTQQMMTVELQTPAATILPIAVSNTNATAVNVPSQASVPAGARSITIPVNALATGRARLDVSAGGYETRSVVVEVYADMSAPGISIAKQSGDAQVGRPGTALGQPLRATLRDANQIPIVGAEVEFRVVQGEALLNPVRASTDGSGIAETVVTLGMTTGPVIVEANVQGTLLRTEFTMATLDAARFPAAGVVNAASFASGNATVVPGSIISIFGTNLSSTIEAAQTVPLPKQLAGTRVEINGIEAPLFYVSPLQINVQAPVELNGPMASLVIRNAVGISDAITLPVGTLQPGIFSMDSSGIGQGAITNAANQRLVDAASPARAGDFIQIFANGLGAVQPRIASGQAAPLQPLSRTENPVEVLMNGVRSTLVDFAGLAPGLVGVHQVNAQVPAGVTGSVQVVIRENGVSSNSVTIEVR